MSSGVMLTSQSNLVYIRQSLQDQLNDLFVNKKPYNFETMILTSGSHLTSDLIFFFRLGSKYSQEKENH